MYHYRNIYTRYDSINHCMAHKLAHGSSSDGASSQDEENAQGKALLNRRDYVQLGVAAVAATFGAGGIVGASNGSNEATDTYLTNFSEYSQ